MRMLLTSGGVPDNGPIRDALPELLGKPIGECSTVAIIDAMLPFPGDKGQMLVHLQEYRALGWAECDILTLSGAPHANVEERLRGADAIFCYGGSNHWLAHAWRVNGFAPLLRELLDEKVYIGLSAGSMIFSRLHAATVDVIDGEREEIDMLGLDGGAPALPLVDWWLMPHLGADFFPHATDAWAAETAAKLGLPIWFLDDRSALRVRDPDADPEVVSDGHWLRYGSDAHLIASQ